MAANTKSTPEPFTMGAHEQEPYLDPPAARREQSLDEITNALQTTKLELAHSSTRSPMSHPS